MHRGFTLIETLVALALLSIVAPVVLESSILSARTERSIRCAEAAALELDRILVESVCGECSTNGADRYPFACNIIREPDPKDSLAGSEYASVPRCLLVCRDAPSLRLSVYVRHRQEGGGE